MIKIFKIVTALILLTPAQALPSNNLNRLKSADSENQFQYFYPSSVVVKNDLSSSLTGEVKSPIELRGIAKEYMMNALEITDESRFKITSGYAFFYFPSISLFIYISKHIFFLF